MGKSWMRGLLAGCTGHFDAHSSGHVPPDGAQTLGFSSRRELPPVLPPSEGVLHVMLLHAMDQQARRCHSAGKL